MTRYHITKAGAVGVCRATSEASCPLTGRHFTSKDEAAFYLETLQTVELAAPSVASLKELRVEASALGKRLRGEVPAGVEREMWDRNNEAEVRQLGAKLAARAAAELQESDAAVQARMKEMGWRVRGAMQVRDDAYLAAIAVRAAAYRTLLAQLRPMSGKFALDERVSDENAVLFQRSIAGCYPQAWADLSDARAGQVPLLVRDSVMSGAYGHDEQGVRDVNETYVPKAERVEYLSFDQTEYKEALALLKDHLPPGSVQVQSHNALDVYGISFEAPASEVYDAAVHGPMVEGRPAGEGWVHGVSLAPLAKRLWDGSPTASPAKLRELLEPAWHRPLLVSKERLDSLTFYRKRLDEEQPEPIVVHEAGHRFAALLPNNALPRLERAFLLRRSKKTERNQYRWMRSVDDGVFAHNAKLVDGYMGRDYLDGRSYELFTTGMESVFGGSYGGLVGFSDRYTRRDTEHRDFVLGVLAAL